MPYKNDYTVSPPLPEAAYHLDTPLDEYDLNWVYHSIPPLLETPGGVRLVPLIPSIHAKRLYDLFSLYPESYEYLPYGPFPSLSSFLTKLELARRDPNTLLFAIYDLSIDFDRDAREEESVMEAGKGSREERLAGIVGVKESQEKNRMTEIGHVHIPPPFQRTHVSTHSIALLLNWTLSPPSPSHPHNLGLRRVQWFANPQNVPSVLAAQKMGMRMEARNIRWERTLPPNRGKVALELPDFVEGERRVLEEGRGGGRHSSLLSLDWERWETPGEGREFVEGLLRREVRRRNVKDIEGLGIVEVSRER